MISAAVGIMSKSVAVSQSTPATTTRARNACDIVLALFSISPPRHWKYVDHKPLLPPYPCSHAWSRIRSGASPPLTPHHAVIRQRGEPGAASCFRRRHLEQLPARSLQNHLTHQLRSIRPAYLSTAPPPRRRQIPGQQHDASRDRVLTNPERDAIDAESKSLLRELNARISTVKRAEDLRNETASKIAVAARAKSGLGALGRWAAGSDLATSKSPEEENEDAARKAIEMHREAVIMYLQKKLESAGRLQSDMMEVRLGREVEKSKSVLYKSRMVGNIPYAEGTTMQAAGKSWSAETDQARMMDQASQPQLSQEQMQTLAVENDEMLRHYEDQLDAISTAEKSILEISQLQNTLIANLEVQGQQISQMEQDSYNTEENLGRGNKELKKASERRSTAQALFWGTAAFCSALVVWDLVI
nr:syntaxin ufe1 [Quercus suber]